MPPLERIADKLEAPALDDRTYRVIRLPNKLEALLVHDADTDKASASVNVNVGSLSDDDDMPGMAHAVEHLLFMGTEKYPVENAYNQYLTAHSGYSNAYTASTETNYFFEVATSSGIKGAEALTNGTTNGITNGHANGHANGIADGIANGTTNSNKSSPLYGALDRFAQFFIAPLFLSSTLDRELRAVDSENKKNLQSDNWRLSQLNKSLSNPKHPYHHFSTGNLQTLRDEPRKRGVEIRKEFMDFHAKHYSANRMKLVVLGRESLDELEDLVEDLFSGVQNKDLPQNRWDGVEPFTEREALTQVFARPVMDNRTLEIYFPYQDEEELYESKPSRYLSHLIGHEGPGSILSYIKSKGWANGLSAGAMPICPGAAQFTISVRLTEDGLSKYDEVVKVVFQYISLLQESPPQEWIVDEIKGMAEVDFRFKEKTPASSFTSKLSSVMQKPLPREWLLSGPHLIRKYDPDAISKALSYLRTDNFRLIIVSRDYPGDWDQREKWYGTEYKCEPIPESLIAAVKRAGKSTGKERLSELHLPHKNEFIPTKLSVEKKEVEEPTKAPKLIRNDDTVRTWWKKDDQFWVPRANVYLSLKSPLVSATPANTVKAKLYCELVKDALVEYSYDAEIAGLEYDLGAFSQGLDVEVSGYNDKMSVLLEKVLVSMRDLEVKPDRFKIVKERLLRAYRNWEFQQPYRQVGDFTRWLGTETGWINPEYLAELPDLLPEDVSNFFPQLLRQTHFEILAHGNLYKEDALKLTNLAESVLKPRALPQSQWQVRRNLILPGGSDFTYSWTLGDPANVNHCIEYYIYVGSVSDKVLRAKLLLLAQMTDEPGFNQLRTKEQLGYIVFTGARMAATTMGYRVIIQSERSPEYLETRINAFISTFGTSLADMSVDDFESHKKSLINKRLEKIKNLSQESGRFWSHITNEYYDFLQVESDVAHLRSLTKDDLIDFFAYYIHPTSTTRAKMSVHMVAQLSAKVAGETMDVTEQKEKIVSMLGKYLTSIGLDGDSEKLATRFENIDVAGGDQSGIITAVELYLREDLRAEDGKIVDVIAQGKQLIGTILSSMGIEVSATTEDGRVANGDEGPAGKVTSWIENVHEFKAGLQATAGARPMKDLSEFEDTEPKL